MLLKNRSNSVGTVLTVSAISMLLAKTVFTVGGPVILGGVALSKAVKVTSKMAIRNVIGTAPIISTMEVVVNKE